MENQRDTHRDAQPGTRQGHHHYHHHFDDSRPHKRLCCRPACGQLAVATLRYSHAERIVLLGPLTEESDPHSWDLCERHASRVTPPQGWTLQRDTQADNMMALFHSVNPSDAGADDEGLRRPGRSGGVGRGTAAGAGTSVETEAAGRARTGAGAAGTGAGAASSRYGQSAASNSPIIGRFGTAAAVQRATRTTSGNTATPSPLSAPNRATPVSRAVEDIQETILRLDRLSSRTAINRHTPPPPDPEDDDAELEQWEEDLMSPLLEAAKERAQDRKLWRGRGEENSRAGRHRRVETTAVFDDHGTTETDFRHPSLRNLAGTRRFRLHALPDPEDS